MTDKPSVMDVASKETMESVEHLPECPHMDQERKGDGMELVEGGGMLAEAQQTCPILMMDHGPLTARKQRDYLNQDNLGVQFTHLNTLCRKQMSVKCY